MADVFASIEEAFKNEDVPRVEALLWPALDQFPFESRLWFYGGCVYFKKGQVAVAQALFHRAVDLDDAPHIYSNLGACYRRLNLHEEGIHVLKMAVEKKPDYVPALTNLGSMFVNEGRPEEGIPYLEKAKAIGTERGAVWNLGLLYLEAARFAEGFDHYREGVTHERSTRSFGSKDGSIPDPLLMTPELFKWARGQRKRVIVWGEQGIGDELMFATILNDAIEDFDVVFECHPRLEKLHRNSTWAQKLTEQGRPVQIYPTRKDDWIQWPINDKVVADYKMPIGDLACYYRRDLASFKAGWDRSGPTYRAKQAEAEPYRERLSALAGDRPIVGLATRGGVMQTSRTYRVIRQQEIDRLMQETNALFVSLDYEDMLGLAGYIEEKYGPDRYRWFPSIVHHYDYDHTAALVSACDMVVTVCQSVAHLAAGIGAQTRVLAAKRCAWREIAADPANPELWYWWPGENTRIYHQKAVDDWRYPLDRAISDVNSLSALLKEAA